MSRDYVKFFLSAGFILLLLLYYLHLTSFQIGSSPVVDLLYQTYLKLTDLYIRLEFLNTKNNNKIHN
jgi:hypothetical protein